MPATANTTKADVRLGVDIGGSGIKGALIDCVTGEMIGERHRIPTPAGGTPEGVSSTVAQLADHFEWSGSIGCGFPAAIRSGQVLTAANISDDWIGQNAVELFQEATGSPLVTVINDADAAGTAEMAFGAGKGRSGLVIMCTLGTGIGTALFQDGVLVPNTELGHLFLSNGLEGEEYASDFVRSNEDLSFKQWGKRVNKYFKTLEDLFWPDLIIVGGGVSKKSEKWMPYLDLNTEIIPAEMRNNAGIVGAAAAACEGVQRR
ncbi:hypothetical protein CYMTET_15082 [Cymbomonas tetramitiformis]|uniref:Polyphosphate glucokinase n=1 Tax=Cymbomonas tetramitiformis TaxID=36881 RepID=A0AAE0GG85_9CHLO|nr:hypothetical protein CYMTET_15082 [Cymbomonas tetramitiformis]|eukprot:gene14500-17142_t